MDSDDFIPSGSTWLDLTLGGYGFALGHTCTYGGLPATTKTGLALEAVINFFKKFPKGNIFYFDAEARLNVDRAEQLGVDTKRLNLLLRDSTEDFYRVGKERLKPSTKRIAYTIEDLDLITRSILKQFGNEPSMLITDSLDSVTVKEEAETALIDRGGYRTEKSKALGEWFRTNKGAIEDSKLCNLVLQQLRDNVGAFIGKAYTTSGGWSPEYYRSQGVMLSQVKVLKRTLKKEDFAIGITLKSKVEKCSIGRPLMEAHFDYYFDYGIDDVGSCVSYLIDKNEIQRLPIKLDEKQMEEKEKTVKEDIKDAGDDEKKQRENKARKRALVIRDHIQELPKEERKKMIAVLQQETRNVFNDLQEKLATKWPKKYED